MSDVITRNRDEEPFVLTPDEVRNARTSSEDNFVLTAPPRSEDFFSLSGEISPIWELGTEPEMLQTPEFTARLEQQNLYLQPDSKLNLESAAYFSELFELDYEEAYAYMQSMARSDPELGGTLGLNTTLKNMWRDGQIDYRINLLAYTMMDAMAQNRRYDLEQTLKRIEELRGQMSGQDVNQEKLITRLLGKATRMLPMQAESAASAVPYALGTMLAAGVTYGVTSAQAAGTISAATGGAATPFAALAALGTTAVGTVASGLVAMRVGRTAEMSKNMIGAMIISNLEKGYDPRLALAASIPFGVAQGLIESAQWDKVLDLIPGKARGMGLVVQRAAAKLLGEGSPLSSAFKTGARLVGTYAHEMTEEMAQAGLDVVEEALLSDLQRYLTDEAVAPQSITEILDLARTTFTESAEALLPMILIPGLAGGVVDYMRGASDIDPAVQPPTSPATDQDVTAQDETEAESMEERSTLTPEEFATETVTPADEGLSIRLPGEETPELRDQRLPLNEASAARRTTEISGVENLEEFKTKIQEAFPNVTAEQADAVGTLVEAHAATVGETADDWINSRIQPREAVGLPDQRTLYQKQLSDAEAKESNKALVERWVRDSYGTKDSDRYMDEIAKYWRRVQKGYKSWAIGENRKTIMSLDLTWKCPQMKQLEGVEGSECAYCYVAQLRFQGDLMRERKLSRGESIYTSTGKLKTISGEKSLVDNLQYTSDQILEMPEPMVQFFNSLGGLRVNSFGDYVHGRDYETYKQIIADAQQKGLTLKIITKMSEAIDDFADQPGVQFNYSTDYQHSTWFKELVSGLPEADQKALHKMISPAPTLEEAAAVAAEHDNVVIRYVGMNAEDQIEAALDDRIGVVTNYHGVVGDTLEEFLRRKRPDLKANLGPGQIEKFVSQFENIRPEDWQARVEDRKVAVRLRAQSDAARANTAEMVARDQPLNPRVSRVVETLNDRGVYTIQSGVQEDGLGLYVTLAREQALLLEKADLPDGWTLSEGYRITKPAAEGASISKTEADRLAKAIAAAVESAAEPLFRVKIRGEAGQNLYTESQLLEAFQKMEDKICCKTGNCGSCLVHCGFENEGIQGAARVFYQMANGEPLAAIQFDQFSRAAIRVFDQAQADVATVVHELSHLWRYDVEGDDLATLEGHYGVKGGQWNVGAEEMFANDLTQYIQEGKAPARSLEKVFAMFKKWLEHIYGWVQRKRSLPPEVTEVFDRMFQGKPADVLVALEEDARMHAFDTVEEFWDYAHTMYDDLDRPDDGELAMIWEGARSESASEEPLAAGAPERPAVTSADQITASLDDISRALADDLLDVGAAVDSEGYVTLYHRTTPAAAEQIRESGKMLGKEDGIFFSTKPDGQTTGYGSEVVTVRVPLTQLQLDDIFDDEAHLRIETTRPGVQVPVEVVAGRPASPAFARETSNNVREALPEIAAEYITPETFIAEVHSLFQDAGAIPSDEELRAIWEQEASSRTTPEEGNAAFLEQVDEKWVNNFVELMHGQLGKKGTMGLSKLWWGAVNRRKGSGGPIREKHMARLLTEVRANPMKFRVLEADLVGDEDMLREIQRQNDVAAKREADLAARREAAGPQRIDIGGDEESDLLEGAAEIVAEDEVQADRRREIDEFVDTYLGKRLQPQTETTKATVRRTTGQTQLERLVSESDALEASIKKAEAAARRAASQAKVDTLKAERARIRELKERQRMVKAARDDVRRLMTDIKKAYAKATKKGVPFDRVQKREILDLLEGVDLVWKRSTKKIARLESTAKFLREEGEGVDMPGHVLDELQILNKTPFSQMTPDQIRTLHDSVKMRMRLAETKYELKVRKKVRAYEEARDETLRQMPKGKFKPRERTEYGRTQKEKITERDRRKRSRKWFMGLGQDKPKLVVERVFGFGSTGYDVVWQQIFEGETKREEIVQTVSDEFKRDLYDSGIDAKSLTSGWAQEEVVTEVAGKRWTLERGHRISIFLLSLDADTRESMLRGVGFRDSKDANAAQPMTEEDIKAIVDSLTVEERVAAETMHEHFRKMGEVLREHFYLLNGYEPAIRKDYFPKYTMPAFRYEGGDFEGTNFIDQVKAKHLRIGVPKGRLIERKDVRLPIYVDNAFDVLNRTILEDAAYLGLEEPLRNASKILSDISVRNEVLRRWGPVYGPQAYRYLDKYLRDVGGASQEFSELGNFIDRHRKGITSFAIAGNLWVSLKQLFSYPFAAPYVPPQHLAAGMMSYSAHPKASSATHKAYDPRYRERVAGGPTYDIADAVEKDSTLKRIFGEKRLRDVGFVPTKAMDQLAVGSLGNAITGWLTKSFDRGKVPNHPEFRSWLGTQGYDAKEILGMDAEQQLEVAYGYFRYVTGDTQPMFSTEFQSGLKREGWGGRIGTMFDSFTNQELSMFRRAMMDAKRGNYRKLAYFGISFAINALGMFAADTARDFMRGREKDQPVGKQLFLSMVKAVGGMYYGARDVTNAAIDGRDVELPTSRLLNYLPGIARDAVAMLDPETQAPERWKAAGRVANNGLDLFLMLNGFWYVAKRGAERVVEGITGGGQ